jgi:hypothetical protein
MKKIIYSLFAVAMMSAMISCKGGKSDETSIVAPEGMNVLELNKYGKPFAIFIPDTSNAKLEIIQQSYGALDIHVGKNFAVSINEQPADIELRKKDVKEDEVNKLKSFITEEPTAIMWESEITQPEFHFLINQKIGNTEYSFEEVKDSEAAPFGKEAVQKMFDSCKNIKENKKETAS